MIHSEIQISIDSSSGGGDSNPDYPLFNSGVQDPCQHMEELHSYLPGRLDPLFPKEFIKDSDESEFELPIIQKEVTLFPNTTIPLRITEHLMVQYLSEKIASARNSSNSNMEIKIGIVTKLTERRRVQERIIHANQAGMRQRMGRWPMISLRGNFVPRSTSSSDSPYDEGDDQVIQRRNRIRPEERSINYGRNIQEDPIIGRIGTVVTITNVYDSSDSDREEIIITCFAANRFVIKSRAHDDSDDNVASCLPKLKYRVSILNDEPFPLCVFQKTFPCVQQPITNTSHDDDLHSVYASSRHIAMTKMAKRVHISRFGMNILYPLKVIDDIVHLINSKSSYVSLKKILSPGKELYGVYFPYRLASNLPLSSQEKLQVLEASCHYQRLHFLLKVMQRKISIRCKQCKSNIAWIGDVFSVSSSAGVSGHYVNEYGAVHQTTTVRNIEESSLACVGRPEVRDSWFPGYAWTIAVCNNCFEHIGWKFTLVQADSDSSNDRVSLFWGLSGSQVI